MSTDNKYNEVDDTGIDDLFRKTIGGYSAEPAPRVWKQINRKLFWHELRHFNFSNVTLKYWVIGSIAGLITGTFLYFGLTGTSEKDVTSVNPAVNAVVSSASVTAPAALKSTVPAGSGSASPHATVAQQPADLKTSAPHAETSYPKPAAVISEKPSAKPLQQPRTSTPASGGSTSPAMLAMANTSPKPEQSAKAATNSGSSSRITHHPIPLLEPISLEKMNQSAGLDTLITINTYEGDKKFFVRKNSLPQLWSVSLGITPEVAFYNDAESYQKMNYWAQAAVTYHVSRFTVSSGIGVGYMLDNGKYRVDYISNDTLHYNYVVGFIQGSNNELIFFTVDSTKTDSIRHYNNYGTKNRYTYLRVPLLFGYQLLESKRFSLNVQAGPAFSWLLDTRKSDPVINYQNARIVRVDEQTPDRLKTNWEIWAELYFEYRITRKLSLYLEPSLKYYMNPTVNQEVSGSPPWTLGLGFGLQFNFEPKKRKP